MISVTNKQLFHDHEPSISDADIREASESARAVISFKGQPVIEPPAQIGFIAVKFVFSSGTSETILLDQFAARLLHTLIEAANKLNWDASSLIPKSGPPN